MTKTKNYKKLKHKESKLVVMSRIDFEIAKNVYERSIQIGLNDEEVSFLLGKRNKYFFDLLNPTEKAKFKTEQLDILPTILETSIKDIVPTNIKAGEEIKLKASKTQYAHKIRYEFTVLNADNETPHATVWEKKIRKGKIRQLHVDLHECLLLSITQGYFKVPRNALAIYLHIKANLEQPFSPADLQKSLSVLTSAKGKGRLLKREIVQAKYVYMENSEVQSKTAQ